MSVANRVNKHQLDRLQGRLGYQFTQFELLKTALTHRSFSSNHNERLEFLGDSILNLVIAEALFTQFPSASEGELSRLRSLMVKGETLAEIAREFSLGDYLYLGEGEMKSGGFRRASTLADVVEAIIGAVYFDASMDAVKQLILKWFDSRLKQLTLEGCTHKHKDPKSILQEWLQGRKKPLPVYEVVQVDGELHDQQYTVTCGVSVCSKVTQGTASSRKTAEKLAAKAMLNLLEIS